MIFPFFYHKIGVLGQDLDLLAPLFAQSIKVVCPCETVYFVGPAMSGDGLPTRWKAGVEVVRNSMQPVRDKGENPILYLPLWAGNELFGVAVLIGAHSQVLELSAAHLLEKSKGISRELHQVKLGAIDPLTKLGNGLVLQARLSALVQADQHAGNALVLFDLLPKAADVGKAGNAVAKMGACLQGLIGHLAFPCHLGQGLFGLCWEGASEETAIRMADQVLQSLKRDNLSRGAVGVVSCSQGDDPKVCFDHVWQTLLVAQKRGPFGICSYSTLVNRAAHPLCPPSPECQDRLRKMMKGVRQFGLVELQSDEAGGLFQGDLLSHLPGVSVLAGEGRGYVFLPRMAEKEVGEWCREAQACFAQVQQSFSMGVSLYPFEKFRKAEMIDNCRKGLLHTAFFGPGTCTVFDGVSLNISGDVYYNEGDMVKAAKEYQRGLQIDSKNVNLLNSMGVTMAQMARYAKAISYFKQVLAVDPRDFMALCNLGFSHVALGQYDQAIVVFEEGLGCDETHFDLLFQLGRIYLQKERYRDAVSVLQRAEQMGPENIEDVSHGAVHRFLGEAYFYTKSWKKGMASLQRAIRYNSHDAHSLSLLGKLYADSGEGLDIGLTFCQQAVELDPESWLYHLHLGQVLLGAGLVPEAVDAVANLLLLEDRHEEVLLLQAKLCEAQGEVVGACAWYKKVLRRTARHKEANKALKRLEKMAREGK